MAKERKSHKRVLTRADVERAIRNTKSNRQASRYLGISLEAWEKWSKYYVDDNGISLYQKHCNQSGKGVKKKGTTTSKFLTDILEGRAPVWWMGLKVLKEQLIVGGYLEEKCERCGFAHRRNVDLKVPVLLHFKDLDKRNAKIENLQFLCYNCYFIVVGDVLEQRQIKAIEEPNWHNAKRTDAWQLPDYLNFEYNKFIGLERSEVQASEITIDDYKEEKKEVKKKKITVEEIKEELEEKEEDFGMDLVSFLKK